MKEGIFLFLLFLFILNLTFMLVVKNSFSSANSIEKETSLRNTYKMYRTLSIMFGVLTGLFLIVHGMK